MVTMEAISPTLTASSSTTAANTSSFAAAANLPKELLDFDMDSGLDFFNFDSFESDHETSTAHSPKTISPNHTPSPLPSSLSPVAVANPLADPLDTFDYDFGFDKLPASMAGPSAPIPVIKQEPIEFGWNHDSGSSSPVMATQPVAVPQPAVAPTPDMSLGPVTPEQQMALQQLMLNILNYQKGLGMHVGAEAAPAPATIQPSLVFSTSPAQASTSTSSAAISPVALMQNAQAPRSPIVSNQAGPSKPRTSSHSSSRSIEAKPRDYDREASPLREVRADSSFSFPDLDAKIENLVPLNDIFSAGRGKGGKKGGGVSSVVRMEDEDLDEDDSWRPSAEEYKKLSSKEKRQLRNKLSARAFRTRRKDYIGTLEEHIKQRDDVIAVLKTEAVSYKNENVDLRRELETLKAYTMKVLHPESAETVSPSPALVNALALPTVVPEPIPAAAPAQLPRRSATPSFNTRKDLSSSIGSSAFWGGSDKNMFGGGGSTICHHLLTPDLVLPESSATSSPSSSSSPTLKSIADLPRVNINPALNDGDARGTNLRLAGNPRDMSSTFNEWVDNNAFSFRSMDSYRMQLWGRLAREAAADKANVPAQLRPKFFVEPKTKASTATHDLSSKGITDRLASSFWSAFEGPSARLDAEKLAAVVTGVAKLKVVAASSSASPNVPSPRRSAEEFNEKAPSPVSAAKAATDAMAATDALSMAMGSLKLVTGNNGRVENFSVRENPLGALSSFFKHAATPTRA